MEVPSLNTGKGREAPARDPLSWQFNQLLVSPDFAAQYLAESATRNAPANAFGKKTARTVALYRPGTSPQPATELSILGNKTTACDCLLSSSAVSGRRISITHADGVGGSNWLGSPLQDRASSSRALVAAT